MQVSCKVKARYTSGKDWTMTTRSKDFFAGIKVKFQNFLATSLLHRQSAAIFMLFFCDHSPENLVVRQ